jgi:hypothetical protein
MGERLPRKSWVIVPRLLRWCEARPVRSGVRTAARREPIVGIGAFDGGLGLAHLGLCSRCCTGRSEMVVLSELRATHATVV